MSHPTIVYTPHLLCLGVDAVLGFLQVICTMQDDAAADPSAIGRVFFKKEAVRQSVIINDDLFRAALLEMPPQDPSQLTSQNGMQGNLVEVFAAVELIALRD